MVACRTYFRGFCAFKFVSTYEATPFNGLLALPYGSCFDLAKQQFETIVVVTLNLCDGSEVFSYVLEAFFVGHFCRIDVLLNAFFLLFIDGVFEVGGCVADDSGIRIKRAFDFTAFEIFEENLTVAKFVGRSLAEYFTDREEIFLICLL